MEIINLNMLEDSTLDGLLMPFNGGGTCGGLVFTPCGGGAEGGCWALSGGGCPPVDYVTCMR